MNNLLKFCIFAVGIVLPLFSFAQSDTTIERNLDEVLVKSKRNKFSTNSTQIITNEQLKLISVENIAEAVKLLNGVNVKDYGGIGGLKTLSVRSLGANHTAVILDGIAVSDCQSGPIDIGRFSINNVENIQLSIGHNDALLQSAKNFASGSVLNINSSKPVFYDKNNKSEIILKTGSFGYFNSEINTSQKLSNNLIIKSECEYLRADGNYPFLLKNGRNISTEKRNNSDIQSIRGQFDLFLLDTNKNELNVKIYGYYSDRHLPGAVILYNPIAREQLWDKNFFVQSNFKHKINNSLSYRIIGKYNYSWNKYEDHNVKYENGLKQDLNKQNEFYISSSILASLNNNFLFSLALDGFYNTLNSNMLNNPQPDRISLLSAFNSKYISNKFSATFTIVGTYITENVEFGTKPDLIKRLSPSFSLKFKPFDNKDFIIRTLIKETFRVPTFNELYYTTIGSTYLKPERAKEFNFGLSYQTKISNKFLLELSTDYYHNNVIDKIVAIPTTYVWKMHNCGKVKIDGLEINFASNYQFFNNLDLEFNVGYNYQEAKDITDKTTVYYKHQIAYTPKHSGNISAILKTKYVNLGYSAIASGIRYISKENMPENEVDKYIDQSVSISKKIEFQKLYFIIKFDILNFTNKQYEIIQYYPMPGRQFRISININF
ncbi:MAG: TonB-dependent receptor [Bacteroidales bacterium]|nr:TonB-dependent receptor [Bacteroidales bacterium]